MSSYQFNGVPSGGPSQRDIWRHPQGSVLLERFREPVGMATPTRRWCVPHFNEYVSRAGEYCKKYIRQDDLIVKPKLTKIFQPKGTSLMQFQKPAGIAFFPYGDVAVADMDNHRIQILDKNWNLVRALRHEGSTMSPHGLAVVPHSHFIATTDQRDRCVKVFNPITGDLVTSFGQGVLGNPSGLAVNSRNQFLVTDTAQHCVFVFDPTGRPVSQFGGYGDQNDQFNSPFWLTVGQRDSIIVSDSWNNRIKVFDPDTNRFVQKYGRWGEGELHAPKGLCVDLHGHVIVCDSGNHRLTRFDQNGTFMQTLLTSHDGIRCPYGITTGKTGELALSGLLNNDLRVYDCFKR